MRVNPNFHCMNSILALVRQRTSSLSSKRLSLPAAAGIALLFAATTAYAGSASQQPQSTPSAAENLYLKVKPEQPVKNSALKPGDVLEGKLVQDVFSGDRKILAVGSSIRLTVDKLEWRRRLRNDHWPWLIKVFTPRHERYPTFKSALAVGPEGTEIPLQVSLLSIAREVEVRSPGTTRNSGEREPATVAVSRVPGGKGDVTLTLQATEVTPAPENNAVATADPGALIAGTQAKVVLLDAVSASRNHPGDLVQARVIQPIWSGSRLVLPEGTLLQGRVVKSVPPRTLSRAGSLHLEFTDLTLPGGASNHVSASLSSVVADRASHFRIDPEGAIHAQHPGKAWMLINVGTTAGIAKEVDDATQLLIEAIISTATDASTAGTSRIVSTCISGIFMLTRHGRDVVLPKFAELSITFDRPVSLPETRPSGNPASGSLASKSR
jgi:hypothetical protein